MQAVTALYRELIADRRSDGELLGAFISERSETAFSELLRRHGPLVWNACRRLLPDAADAEDAFQAAFLVLVRRARRLTTANAIGPWLHRVAVWTARNVRRKNARRLARQTTLTDRVSGPAPDADLQADLDAALLELPTHYRDSIVLCHLQGFSRREAAERLGCPEGTLSAWLNRGLAKLRERLRGLDPTLPLAVTVAVPAVLAANTARAAAAATIASGFIPPTLSSIVEGVLQMFWVKKATAATLALCAVFALGMALGLSSRSDRTAAVAQDRWGGETAVAAITPEAVKSHENIGWSRSICPTCDPDWGPQPAFQFVKPDEGLFGDRATLATLVKDVERVSEHARAIYAQSAALETLATDTNNTPLALGAAIIRGQSGTVANLADGNLAVLHHKLVVANALATPQLTQKGQMLEVIVVGRDRWSRWTNIVREYDKDGRLVGSVVVETEETLETILRRALKDPAGPRELWMTALSNSYDVYDAVGAAKRAGFTTLKLKGTVTIRKVEVPIGTKVPFMEKGDFEETEFDGADFEIEKLQSRLPFFALC